RQFLVRQERQRGDQFAEGKSLVPPFLAVFEFLPECPFLTGRRGGKDHLRVDHGQVEQPGKDRLAAAQGKIVGIEGRSAQIVVAGAGQRRPRRGVGRRRRRDGFLVQLGFSRCDGVGPRLHLGDETGDVDAARRDDLVGKLSKLRLLSGRGLRERDVGGKVLRGRQVIGCELGNTGFGYRAEVGGKVRRRTALAWWRRL